MTASPASPPSPPPSPPSPPSPLRQMAARWLKPQLPLLIGGTAANLLVAAATGALPILIQQLSDQIFSAPGSMLVWFFPLLAAGLMMLRAAASFIAAMAMGLAGRRMGSAIQHGLLAALVRADYGAATRTHSGAMAASFLNDVRLLETSLPSAAVALTRDGFSVLGLFAAMFWLDPWLASFCLIAAPPAFFVLRRFGQRTRRAATGQMEAVAVFSARLAEIMRGLRIIKAYGAEAREIARMQDSISAILYYYFRTLRGQSAAGPVMEVFAALAIGALLLYAATAAQQGTLSQGEFTGFVAAMLLLYQPLRSLARFHALLQQASAAAARIMDLFSLMREEAHAEETAPLMIAKGEIRFEKVCFSYPGAERPALKDINLVVKPGESLALVGPSGSGKTTLMNLLLRLYQPDAGSILIDGQDIALFSPASLRRHIAFVSQEPLLFDETIADNIAYAQPNASRSEIERAARDAQAHEFIAALPQTYDSQIGEGGQLLSGGQRQRLALARALLRRAPLVLMDEPTSALDGESERKLQAAMARLMHGRTNIIIAHRLSTITGATRICVLDKGRLVESGSHQSLLAQQGVYARLFAQPQTTPSKAVSS